MTPSECLCEKAPISKGGRRIRLRSFAAEATEMTVMGESNVGNQSFLLLSTLLLCQREVCLLQQA